MNIVKEPGKIILELTPEEDEIMTYFIQSRGSNVLNEYFEPFIISRRETKKYEEHEKINNLINQLSPEEKEKLISGRWNTNG